MLLPNENYDYPPKITTPPAIEQKFPILTLASTSHKSKVIGLTAYEYLPISITGFLNLIFQNSIPKTYVNFAREEHPFVAELT